MKKILAMLLVLVMVLSLAACGEKTPAPVETQGAANNPTTGNNETPTEEVGQVYNIRVAGGSAYRCETLVAAAELLNQQLAAEGIKDTVTVEWIEVDSMDDSLVIWQQEGNMPEILQNSISMKYYEAGYTVNAAYVVEDEAHTADLLPGVADMAKYAEGEYYGVPLDTEFRGFMVYKPALVQLGWTEEQITSWINDMRAGKLTLDDFQDVAKQVVDAGICEYGLTHRPNKGADWRYVFISFAGGELPINSDGLVTVSTKHVANYLGFFRECVQLGITPYNSLTDFNWDMLEGDIWPNGKTFAWIGNISTKGDCMKASGVTSEYWDENFISMPIPVTTVGESPACGANPHGWMLTTSSQSSEKMAEYVRRLLDCVLAPEYQVVLSVESGHVAITKSVLEHPTYAADRWLSDIEWATPYLFTTTTMNPSLGLYGHSQELYDALQEAELDALVDGARSIDEIAEECVAKMTFNMDEGTFIIVD